MLDGLKKNVHPILKEGPLGFIRNAGQMDSKVYYYTKGSGVQYTFMKDEVGMSFMRKAPEEEAEDSDFLENKRVKEEFITLRFIDPNQDVNLEAQGEFIGKVNYFRGKNQANWFTNLSTYKEVVYRGIWPKIDLIFYRSGSSLKYDFIVNPGANIENIRLTYKGAGKLFLDPEGNLLVHTRLGILKDERPYAYQEITDKKVPVECSFTVEEVNGTWCYGFKLGKEYNPQYPITIDPGIGYSTFIGGGGMDEGYGIAVDALGFVYITGRTASGVPKPFPTNSDAYQKVLQGSYDAFVMKLSADGASLIYSTYLGGGGDDLGYAIAVDGLGAAYITGFTNSRPPNSFPTTQGAFQTSYNGGNIDAFITKLAPDGASLIYSSYLGGGGDDKGYGIALDASGCAYIAGSTSSKAPKPFPTTPGAFMTSYNGGEFDVFVSKMSADGSELIYSTYLGGGDFDVGTGVTVDALGCAYVVGYTSSTDPKPFPTTPGAFQTLPRGGSNAFVVKLSTDGASLVYATYLGGGSNDEGWGITVDTIGNAYITGRTTSAAPDPFPTTAGAFQTFFSGGFYDAFITKFSSDGSRLIYSTYLGGGEYDEGNDIAVDNLGYIYIVGTTSSKAPKPFPITHDAFQTSLNGVENVFVTTLSTDGASLVYSTYLGGSGVDEGWGIAVDQNRNVFITGRTNSEMPIPFPTTEGAYDILYNGGAYDAFVTKLNIKSLVTIPQKLIRGISPACLNIL
ncbi:MAG: SBBP repeat-containing protein [Clostridia bacterium]|nr:SBBP repeat-containing protein [Clostridia bacterium]